MQQLIDYLHAIARMSPALEQHLRTILRRQVFKKKDLILKTGEVCRHIRFIESGIVRIYVSNGDEENTTWIQKENEIFIAIGSFFDQLPSAATIEAIEDNTVTWGITYAELENTIRLYPEFAEHQNAIKTKYHKIVDAQQAMLRLSPEQRYEWLLQKDAELLLRVPAPYLSSYLGIRRERFFHIRKALSRAKTKGK
jgi:CRP/FNR family transcriptional regulator, anaerobic regulatory protein